VGTDDKLDDLWTITSYRCFLRRHSTLDSLWSTYSTPVPHAIDITDSWLTVSGKIVTDTWLMAFSVLKRIARVGHGLNIVCHD